MIVAGCHLPEHHTALGCNGPVWTIETQVLGPIPSSLRIVVDACAPPLPRTALNGLRFLQRFRRETHSQAPALVYSFLSREALAKRFSMMQEGVPGIRFLRAPFSLDDFRNALNALIPMTDLELRQVLRWHCGLDEEWRSVAHGIAHHLQGWPSGRDQARSLLSTIEPLVRDLAPDQVQALESLEEALNGTLEEVRSALQALEDGICGAGSEPPPAPFRRPPRGFDSVVVVDDAGYDMQALEYLRQLGYCVCPGVAEDFQTARVKVKQFKPAVVLADLGLPRRPGDAPTTEAGLELLEFALGSPSVRLVIAVSRARATGIPEGVEDCCGPEHFRDAERIHRLIWRRAHMKGVEGHA